MVSMARASKQAAWWQNYREVIPQDFFTFIGLEASAIRISQYQGVLVPGLLQSPEYIKALLRSGGDTPGQQRRGLEVRLRRQELISDDGPEFFFILDESTLRRAVGDSAVMREQLLKLKEVADHPRVSIRIMPFSAGVLRGQKNSFEILRLSEEPDDYALIIDQGYKDLLMQVPSDETRTYVALFSKLEEKALSEDETRYVLDERLKEVEKD
jgi:hypothetical protein